MRRLAAAAALVLLLGACGDDADDGAATTTTSTTAATTTTSPDREPPGDGAAADLEAAEVALIEVAALDQPLGLAFLPNGDLLVAEKGGHVVRLPGEEQVLDLSREVSSAFEQGLLGIAVHPDGDRLYLSYTNVGGESEVHEWALDDDGTPDPASRRRLVEPVPQPAANHNGGHITFGPDGLLWWGLGDGGGAGDQYGNAQDEDNLLGSIVRLDVDGGEPEPVVIGLKNPWRFSFDSETGDLWIADVGQDAVEEVDLLPAGGIEGANLGWPMLEGSRPYSGEEPPEDHVLPVYEYSHDEGNSIAGGVVYRGEEIPELRGAYLFADSYSGFIRAIVVKNGEVVQEKQLLKDGGAFFVSFAEDPEGEVYVLDLAGRVLRLGAA